MSSLSTLVTALLVPDDLPCPAKLHLQLLLFPILVSIGCRLQAVDTDVN